MSMRLIKLCSFFYQTKAKMDHPDVDDLSFIPRQTVAHTEATVEDRPRDTFQEDLPEGRRTYGVSVQESEPYHITKSELTVGPSPSFNTESRRMYAQMSNYKHKVENSSPNKVSVNETCAVYLYNKNCYSKVSKIDLRVCENVTQPGSDHHSGSCYQQDNIVCSGSKARAEKACRRPFYRNKLHRLLSFGQQWQYTSPSYETVAEAGFFYQGLMIFI